MPEQTTSIEQERQRADLLQLRLDEADALIDDLLRRIARLRTENEALWEERSGPRWAAG